MDRPPNDASEAAGTPNATRDVPVVAELIAEGASVVAGSDAAPSDRPGPSTRPRRPTVAGRSTEDDDANAFRATERFVLVAALNRVQRCPKCLQRGQNIICTNSNQLDKHIKEEHPTICTLWQCEGCSRTFPKVHGWRVHTITCAPRQVNEALPYPCVLCDLSFATQRGRSAHERHEHPALRNEKRAAIAENPGAPGGRRATVWSDEELERLAQLEQEFIEERFINIKLKEFFPDRTNKQISDARRRLRDREQRRARAEEELADGEEEQEPVHPALPDRGDAQDIANVLAAHATNEPPEPDPPMMGPEDAPLIREARKENGEAGNWSEWTSSLLRLLDSNDYNEHSIDALYDELLNQIKPGCDPRKGCSARAPRRPQFTRNHRPARGRPPNRTWRRKFAYARCQDLYNNNTKRLAEAVTANNLSILQPSESPAMEPTRKLYEQLWGEPGPGTTLPPGVKEFVPIEQILVPVTALEVERKVARISSGSAAGPDGVTRADLQSKQTYVALSRLFNVLLHARHYPKAWRTNRTTLIPKAGKDTSDVRNWRPITVSSMISRLFSALLDQRLRGVLTLNCRQKGFTEENGCYANIQLLQAAISNAKKRGGVISVLDISKAFDTVPHSSIAQGLERKGIPPSVASYVANMYRGCGTTIKSQGGEVKIELQRGVKQGDPLSPLIFNLAIEPLLERLQTETQGMIVDDQNLAVMAFADDLVLLSRDARMAQRQLGTVSEYLAELGMKLSVEKCASFEYVPGGKTWYLRDPSVRIIDQAIPYAPPEDALRYLGARVSPWFGVLSAFDIRPLEEVLGRIRALPLKPMQKVNLLNAYILPRFTYGLICSPPSGAALERIDRLVRSSVREILHLTPSTSVKFFYTPKREGGLGLTELKQMTLIAALRNAIKARASRDPVVSGALRLERVERRLEAYADTLKLPWPLSLQELDEYKIQLKKSYRTDWAKQVWQGQGVDDVASQPIANEWLRRGDLMKSSRVIDGIKLRTNTVPTRAFMKLMDDRVNASCRLCQGPDETLGHILGQCSHTKAMRIRRHDEIKHLLRARLAKQHDVLDEPQVVVKGERFKPDLVVNSNEEGVLVLDITVRYEKGTFLAQAAREKVLKYTQILGVLKEQLNARQARVIPIVVGSRGALPVDTVCSLKRLGFSKADLLTISMTALRSSIEIIGAFMDT